MSIKVIILRRGEPEKFALLKPLLVRLRALAMKQPGYVSGETYLNLYNRGEYLVISTWSSLEQWEDWLTHPERAEVQSEIDELLGEPSLYQVYQHA
jgi:heme oxygenase (mycobilin-producing)